MRISAAMATIACVLATGVSLALAQPLQRPGFPGRGQQPPVQPMPPRQIERQIERPAPPQRPPFERMSPEERQQLRRDIEQHGREIYPARRREGRR